MNKGMLSWQAQNLLADAIDPITVNLPESSNQELGLFQRLRRQHSTGSADEQRDYE